MADIFSYLKDLFSNSSEKNVPVVHELISRDEDTQLAFEQWKTSKRFQRVLSAIGAEDEHDLDMRVIHTPTVRGIVIKYVPKVLSKLEFQHLFDYFKEIVKEQTYVSYTSDVQTAVKNNGVETKERHYLKPKFSYDEERRKCDQKYGNVQIEHLLIDDEPKHIKLWANVYSDFNYDEPLDFNVLLEKLLVH